MAEKVIIEFVPDFTQLTSAIDNLQQKGILKKEDADTLNVVNKGMKDFAANTDKATTSVTHLGDEVRKDVKSVNDLSNEVKEVPIKVFGKSVDEAFESLAKFGKKTGEVVAESKSLKGQLRELKAEMAALEDQGKDNTAEFEKMQIKAGQLSDQIGDTSMRVRVLGDDSRHIKAISQAISGAASAFSVGQGAMALFGSENKEVEKALLKVNAAMAIANGLQQINEVIQKQSYLSIMAKTAATKASTIATGQETVVTEANAVVNTQSAVSKYLMTAAESEYIIVSKSAAIAQWLLNAAMAANPAVLIVAAIAALVTALMAFSSKTEDAKDRQERLNKAHQAYLDLIEKELEADRKWSDLREMQKENEIEILRAKGLNVEADKKQIELDKEKIKNAENIIRLAGTTKEQILEKQATYATDVRFYKESLLIKNEADRVGDKTQLKRLDAERAARIKLYEDLYSKLVPYAVAMSEAEQKLALDNIELVKKTTEASAKAKEKKIEDAKKIADATNKTLLEIFDEDVALSEARLLNAKKGGKEELNAKEELIHAKAAKDREANQLSEASATAKAAKVVLINAKETDDILNLNIAYNDKKAALAKKAEDDENQKKADKVKLIDDEYKQKIQIIEQYYTDKKALLITDLTTGKITEKQYKDEVVLLDKDKVEKLKTLATDYKSTATQASADILAADKKNNADSLANFEKTTKEKEDLKKLEIQSAINAAKEISDAVFEIESNNRKTLLDEKLSDLEKRKETELANTALTATQKKVIEDKYAKLEAKEKTKAWEADKQAKLTQAIINGALSIANIWATNLPPAAAILSAVSLVAVGAQIAVINAQKVPKFAKGKNVGDMYEGPAIIGEAGRELRFDKDGSVKLYNSATMDHVYKDTIIAPNAITEALLSGTMPMANGAVNKYVSSQTSNVGFDYDKLATSITDNMRNHPKVAINIDEKGFEKRIIQGSNERTILNDRYKMTN